MHSTNSSLPRLVTCTNHDADYGNLKEYSWDQTSITVDPDLFSDDKLLFQNIIEGHIISSKVYPLIFDAIGSHKEVSCRSVEFYRQVDQDHKLYSQLLPEEKHFFLIGVRDLFVGLSRNMLSEDEQELLKRVVDLIDPEEDDDDIICKEILNMRVTPYPTRSHKLVRFIPAASVLSGNILIDECFLMNNLDMVIGFVDPCELSYHNFENIVNLDPLFRDSEQFKIETVCELPNSDILTFNLIDGSNVLKSLDKYNLYVQPLNKLSRGGQRFIFSSQILSKNLTDCLKKYMDKTEVINPKFRFVNWVFRYNKFKPKDRKFTCHYDSPYHDPTKKHYSRYTMLLYLTSGSADPVLSFEDGTQRMETINTHGHIKGIIFDQKYKHEGKSFVDGDKIFLRTELVYEYEPCEYESDNQVAKIFNQACYMTKQSLFTSEVEKFADNAFNQAAEARLSHKKSFKDQSVLLYKKYEQKKFITNGYDYWFQPEISLQDAFGLALCDYFNCRLESGKFFNKVTSQKRIALAKVKQIDEIFKYLNYKEPKQDLSEVEDVEKLINKEEEKEKENDQIQNEEGKYEDDDDDDDEEEKAGKKENDQIRNEEGKDEDQNGVENKLGDYDCDFYSYNRHKPSNTNNCCPNDGNFNHKTNKTVLDTLERLSKDLEKMKENHIIYILDKKVNINGNSMIVTDKTITFKHSIPEFNFASGWPCRFCPELTSYDRMRCKECYDKGRKHYCWYKSYPKNYIEEERKEAVMFIYLPPIPYITSKRGHHLKLDVFHSDLARFTKRTITQYNLV